MKWIPNDIKVVINGELPTNTLVALDLEYDENGTEISCVGMFDGTSYYHYSSVGECLLRYLRSCNWIVADGIHAELPVLNKLYGGFTTDRIYADVKIMGYVFDSTLKNWGLKNLAKEYLKTEWPKYKDLKKEYKFKSIKELPQEVLIDYNGMDCVQTWKLWGYFRKNYNQNQWAYLNNIEQPMNYLIAKIEEKGVLIDTKEVRRIHKENSKKRRLGRKSLIRLAGGLFNPNSPKQVLPLLQQFGAKVSKTDEDTIKRYDHLPFVSELLAYRGLNKICSTYTIPLYTEVIKAVDQRVRARFGQNTLTGRLSSSDPINLQNQPPEIRSCFIAKEGHSFIEADYSNIEWRIPGHFSGDPAIISELSKRDGDIHRQTARLMFGEGATEEHRKIAKTCNFLLTNSGRAKRLAGELGCSYKEAEDIYRRFWDGYRGLAHWTKETKKKARQDVGISTMFGRWVQLPKIKAWCGRSNCPVVGPQGYFCKDCFVREETEREAVSVRVQGSGADIIKLAMLRLYRDFGYVPVLTVHDSIMYEVEDSRIEEVKKNVQEVMENVVSLRIPLYVDIGVGKSWGEC